MIIPCKHFPKAVLSCKITKKKYQYLQAMTTIQDDILDSCNGLVHSASQFINPARPKKEEDEIFFIRAQNCCVCFVDIVVFAG